MMNLAHAQNNEEKAVAAAVEKLRTNMVTPDRKALDELTLPALSYGHSSALIEDKATFVESLVSGKYDFKTIDLSDQTIKVDGNTALVRHTLFANTHDAGKDPGTVKLHILTVWQKQAGGWKLLARQAVRI
ncbi:nuclear transport factor 2 family protein [Telluribacter sp.]|uniref:nuclear transport factor 2 family protein n=1 Tax=Telluribacter sp. TaxID=1978767 RepID=UPI002E13300A|nr:nuclear transport factor 2 family protein [Telluribacter sp.]